MLKLYNITLIPKICCRLTTGPLQNFSPYSITQSRYIYGPISTTFLKVKVYDAALQQNFSSSTNDENKQSTAQEKFDDRISKQITQIHKGNKNVSSPIRGTSAMKDAEVQHVKKEPAVGTHSLPHPIWSYEDLHSIEITHKKPEGIIDKMAYYTVQTLRKSFDILSGYNRNRSEKIWLNRIIFLETVAGVPGMVAAMVRHLHSLRRMQRDHGWIHTLLEEAENERMHLMTALQVKQPSRLFRWGVVVTQGAFVTYFSLAYLISPKYCHRMVGYLEEEAVITYTKCLKEILEEKSSIHHWTTTNAPKIAIDYWKLLPDAKLYDVILAIRADEAHHRVVNHTLGSMKPDEYNPYKPGE